MFECLKSFILFVDWWWPFSWPKCNFNSYCGIRGWDVFRDVGRNPQNFLVIDLLAPNLVSYEGNPSLRKVPTGEDIKAMVFDMDPLSAPGPDGYTDYFFQHF